MTTDFVIWFRFQDCSRFLYYWEFVSPPHLVLPHDSLTPVAAPRSLSPAAVLDSCLASYWTIPGSNSWGIVL